MLADPDTRFSATPDGVMRFATFMHRVGIISVAPKSGRICSSPKFKIGPAAEACETRYAVERVGAFVFAIGYKNRGLLLVSLFFWIHYFFSSLTSHTAAVLPIVLAVGAGMPGVPQLPVALLCVYSLGLMGVISPYATGPAPIYFGSGYVARGDFWKLGLIFGVLLFVALLGIGTPWLLWRLD